LEKVELACQYALKNKAISKDVIVNTLLRQRDEKDLEDYSHLSMKYPTLHTPPQISLKAYDSLLSQGGQ
jgi:hypothetical protein